ncbi:MULTISPECIES: DUF6338 family protein [unclassified Sphingopyxis]|uniref:DUF6338 family protein n=1 Tax=unclassified Sphingopyxis TaxID=2614943 RepID=UPI000B297C6C|nr:MULTISPECIES: DUF6338 family protein [unclassified Sphingopyxis]
MAELPTTAEITNLASLLAPGLIISTIRIRAITGSIPDLKDRVITYGLISTGYFAAITPLFHVDAGLQVPHWLWSLLQYFIVPVIVGIAAAYAYQHKVSYRVAEYFRLHIAHHLPAAWDYAFESLSDSTYLLVTLQDGTQIGGKWARGSFASSSKEERDLLLFEMWQVPAGDSDWTPLNPPRAILICGKDIRHVEFLGA